MKKFILNLMLTLSIFALMTFASEAAFSKCDDSQSSKDIFKSGSVLLNISEKKCSSDNKNCVEQFHKDRDYCLNEKVVVKFSCQNDESTKLEISCPENSTCQKGACKKN